MEQRASVIPVKNETTSTATRTTADGRLLTYQLTVLQQPARARACGQGAKSSADRRPVDPPPIVELQIFQGEKREEEITFQMSANYFLFAELEQARPLAHGRVPQERAAPTVLTGTPVSGMVYLDRPKPAGYFIFPDLSVRHEGKYRLSFSLFEELKQAKDMDKPEDGVQPQSGESEHVTHRLEVKSEPFHVFSAKKFPGLTESTSLSRMVAEQGCRVRIRRDVRMRRRETKNGGKDWDDYEDDTAAARARASATPDPMYGPSLQTHGYPDPVPRPRSASNSSHQSLASVSRRPSMQDIGSAYHSSGYGTAPHTPSTNSYGQASPYGTSQAQQQFPAPTFVQQPPQQQQQAPSMPPPLASFQSQTCPPPPVPVAAQPSSYYSYPPAPAPPQVTQSAYNAPSKISSEYHRSSAHHAALPPPPPPLPQGGFAQQPAYPPQVSQPQPTYQTAPPPPPQAAPHHYSSVDAYGSRPAPLEPQHNAPRLPPINTSMIPSNKLEASSPISGPHQNNYFSATQTSHETNKRSFGNVFSDRHQSGPLRQGARPSTYSHQDSLTVGGSLTAAADDDDSMSGELDPASLGMAYRRADGRQIMRALPGHN